MSERVYLDSRGNPIHLWALCVCEPHWAAQRITALTDELESLRRDNALLLAIRDAADKRCFREHNEKIRCMCALCDELEAYDNREKP